MNHKVFDTSPSHAEGTAAGDRFSFGANWSRFLLHLNASRIESAKQSLQQMLGRSSLDGMRFLDAGSGSGLFSLAARHLGAKVHSFDFDPQSVACTQELRKRLARDHPEDLSDTLWNVEDGSVLDAKYLESLGLFDVVYSWGVVHHTGEQWRAMDNLSRRVKVGGSLFISVYNDQGFFSKWWSWVKRLYNHNTIARAAIVLIYIPYFIGLRSVYRWLSGKGEVERGMSLWFDMIDWLGGHPFEVARPEAVFRFFADRGFELRQLTTAGSTGACNEFVFERVRSEHVLASSAVPLT